MNNMFLIKDKIYPYLEKKVRLYFYRKKAHGLIKKVVNKRGYKIVDRKKRKTLKSYAKETFGSSSFWPWLSLYTELRGEFKAGWLPNDYYMAHLLKKYNPESIRISEYKTLDYKIFPDFALKPLILKIGANLYDSNHKRITTNQAEDILSEYDEVVLKEDLKLGGHGVKFIRSGKFNVDNYSDISSYVVQPVIHQHKNLKALNNKAVSTVRVLTYLSGKEKAKVKYSYLRFGIGESRVDNSSSGGGFCFIKPDGSLADIGYDSLGIEMGKKHPDTGTLFKSVSIPNYEKILQECIESHNIFPYLKFIGWDVTIDKSGELVLLEWNSYPLMWLAEAIQGPFFKEEV